jgi:hypothetical protein
MWQSQNYNNATSFYPNVMGNQKKRKTQHLSDEEIWDDSALIRSWDEAVAEYEVSYFL